MKGFLLFIGAVLSLVVGFQAYGQNWHVSDRSKTGYPVKVTVSETRSIGSPDGAGANLSIIEAGEDQIYVRLDLFQEVSCPMRLCKLIARFDDGGEVTLRAGVSEHNPSLSVLIADPKTFVRAASMSKELQIQYESAGGEKHHYRFSTQYMPVRIKDDPAVSFLKHQIGSELSSVPGLLEQTGLQGAGKECFSEMPAEMFVDVESAGSVADGCFLDGKLFLFQIKIPKAEKGGIAVFNDALRAAYGTPSASLGPNSIWWYPDRSKEGFYTSATVTVLESGLAAVRLTDDAIMMLIE